MHVIQEDQDLQRANVGTCCDQRHRNRNTEIHVISERFDQLVGIPARIGDLLHELVIRSPKNFLCDFDNQLRMRFRNRKNQSLRKIVEIRLTFRVKLRVDRILVFFEDLANLVAHDDAAIQLVLVELTLGYRNLFTLS